MMMGFAVGCIIHLKLWSSKQFLHAPYILKKGNTSRLWRRHADQLFSDCFLHLIAVENHRDKMANFCDYANPFCLCSLFYLLRPVWFEASTNLVLFLCLCYPHMSVKAMFWVQSFFTSCPCLFRVSGLCIAPALLKRQITGSVYSIICWGHQHGCRLAAI